MSIATDALVQDLKRRIETLESEISELRADLDAVKSAPAIATDIPRDTAPKEKRGRHA
jgi:uncharacterized small protein (DUF1192 family)